MSQPSDGRAVILTVEPDESSLGLVERALERRYAADYQLISLSSPADALAALQRLAAEGAEVAMVLADLKMTDPTGVDFLVEAGTLHPDAKRLLLVSWGEMETSRELMLRAVARGHVEGAVAKPWRDAHESFYRAITGYLEEWDHEHRPQFQAIRIVGDRWNAESQALRDTLHRSGVPFGFYDRESVAAVDLLNNAPVREPLPVAILYNGQAFARPTPADIAAALGVNANPVGERYDVTVVGSGPAGMAAAVYASSEGLSVIVVEESALGGQASTSAMIRNYLGFPRGLSGAELAARGYRQAWFFGTRFLIGRKAVDLRADGEDRIVVLDDGTEVRSRAVILATGVGYRRLSKESIARLVGRGVFYGAPVTEAPGMVGEHVVVVGGGNSSAQMALYLARWARKVTLVTRGAALDEMSEYLVQGIRERANIEVRLNTVVADVEGDPRLTAVRLHDNLAASDEVLAAAGLFILIGAEPRTDWLPPDIERDERGYVATGGDVTRRGADGAAPRLLETSMEGVFAVGDVRLGSLKRIAAAVGEGSTVVRLCHEYFARRAVATKAQGSPVRTG